MTVVFGCCCHPCLPWFSVLGLATLALSVSLQADNLTRDMIENRFENLWMVNALGQEHWKLLDLAQKTKAQLLLWDEVNKDFRALEDRLKSRWEDVEAQPDLSAWYLEVTPEREAVSDFLDLMRERVDAQSYYEVGRLVTRPEQSAALNCCNQHAGYQRAAEESGRLFD